VHVLLLWSWLLLLLLLLPPVGMSQQRWLQRLVELPPAGQCFFS